MLRTDRQQFESGVTGIRESIANGVVLQVNLTRREEAEFEGDPWALYEDLACAHPAPFAAYLEGPGFAIASCSPERFLHLRGDMVEARPIKGTVARGEDDAEDMARRSWLAASLKDRANDRRSDAKRSRAGCGDRERPRSRALRARALHERVADGFHRNRATAGRR